MTAPVEPVLGFRFGAVSAGLRKDGRIDVGLAVADRPCTVAGRFTRNLVRAAPVEVAAARTARGLAQVVLANSGGANACTGQPGLDAALATTQEVAHALGIESELVLPASTGVIGALLPAAKIVQKVPELVASLSVEGHSAFAKAICTTDRWEKVATAKVGHGAKLLGIAKGAGMIHPWLGRFVPESSLGGHATLLTFLFTDAIASARDLDLALGEAVEMSFNCASVDGDTSTNDTVLLLASGASGVKASVTELKEALIPVCEALAESMVKDGEGSQHVAELTVSGLRSDEDARAVARTIATSLLVKTAMFGQDPNWGRWLAAAGRAGVPFDPRAACFSVDGITIVKDGLAVGSTAEVEAKRHMTQPRYRMELVLGAGPGKARYFMTDLGHAYVDVNAGYRS